MFGLFKKNRTNNLADDIRAFLSQDPANPQIDIWIDDQILFQVMRWKAFQNLNVSYNSKDFVIVHFFNQNKTYTLDTWNKFKEEKPNEVVYFEEPKGTHNYLKNIGSTPEHMAQEIREAITYYIVNREQNIRVELNAY